MSIKDNVLAYPNPDEIEDALAKALMEFEANRGDVDPVGYRIVSCDFADGESRVNVEIKLATHFEGTITLPEGWTVYEPALVGHGCNHKPKEYVGFTERYMYCEKCGDKL